MAISKRLINSSASLYEAEPEPRKVGIDGRTAVVCGRLAAWKVGDDGAADARVGDAGVSRPPVRVRRMAKIVGKLSPS